MRLIKYPPEVRMWDEIWRQAIFVDDGVAIWHITYFGHQKGVVEYTIGTWKKPVWTTPMVLVDPMEWVDQPESKIVSLDPSFGNGAYEWYAVNTDKSGPTMTYHDPSLPTMWDSIIENPTPFLIRLALSS